MKTSDRGDEASHDGADDGGKREVSSRSVATRWSRHRSDRFATGCLVLSISCFLTFNTLCFLTFGP